ncbi:5082_t:CDS:2 [Funneliformis mosseae]|uniref:5082_t:CDS:1 n=1 Tax=Funneliformis mosseae TaxID=27381 RepID=A0A9N9H7L9_FUNMO|nr:5082_t:CDS:2 [Funneliformis mosseae]
MQVNPLVSAKVSESTASIHLTHNSNSSDDSKEVSPSNLLKAEDNFYKMLLENCVKDCVYFDKEIDFTYQLVKETNKEIVSQLEGEINKKQRTIRRSAPTDHTIFSTMHYVATQLSTDRKKVNPWTPIKYRNTTEISTQTKSAPRVQASPRNHSLMTPPLIRRSLSDRNTDSL